MNTEQVLTDLLRNITEQGITLATLMERIESVLERQKELNYSVAEHSRYIAGNTEQCRSHRDMTAAAMKLIEAHQLVIGEQQHWIDQEKGSRKAIIVVSHVVSFLIGTVVSIVAALLSWHKK